MMIYNKKSIFYLTDSRPPDWINQKQDWISLGAVYPFILSCLSRKGKENMKTPKAKKLPSGSWYVRVRIDGQDVSITRPTEKEALAEAMAVKAGMKDALKQGHKTLTKAIDAYISARENVLSPSTIRGYRTIQQNRFQGMMNRDVYTVTQEQWQRAVNAEAKQVSAKTLTNAWRFLSSVITEETGKKLTVRLPQVVPAVRPWLTAEQIPIFVEAVKGDPIEIPALLALSSLRRSEIINLRWKDVDMEKGVLHINGAAVYDENSKLVRKSETKNKSSRRIVPIIQPLREALERADRKGEYLTTWNPNAIMLRINRICERSGLPKVGFHGLRHPYVKHTTKKYNSEKQKTQATKMDLIAWGFCLCIVSYSKRSWTL